MFSFLIEMDVTIGMSPSTQTDPPPDKIALDCGKDEDDATKAELLQQFKQQIKGKRAHRKRRHSIAEDATSNQSLETKSHPVKHRRQYSTHIKKGYAGDIILPTNFLLGGNIRDPLNLKSMLDEKVNSAMNAVTPSSSPLPPRSSKISIVIPTDMTDPLGLNRVHSAAADLQTRNQNKDSPLTGQVKSNHRKKKKRRKSQHEKMLVETQPNTAKEEVPSTGANLVASNNQKENVKSAKNRRSNSKLLNIEDDAKVVATPQVSRLTIALPKVSIALVMSS